jgi:NitT/TauT family transport system substrate-binding protein
MRNVFLIILASFLFLSCSNDQERRLKISATTWIGYTPLFYAQEKGWLEELNIKLIHVSSLAENMYLYQAGNADAYVGTQYEYEILKNDLPELYPVMLFDRSNGGDLVMGSVSLEELKDTPKIINVYLELDSINNTLFKDFVKTFDLKDKSFTYFNKDQAQIKLLEADLNEPSIVVTYIPYNFQLEKQGFKELASTKENLNLLVVDAMFTKKEVFEKHKEQFVKLKKLVDQAVLELQKDPKAFFATIKPYMEAMSYEEFRDALNDIVWINTNISQELEKRIRDSGLPTKELL